MNEAKEFLPFSVGDSKQTQNETLGKIKCAILKTTWKGERV